MLQKPKNKGKRNGKKEIQRRGNEKCLHQYSFLVDRAMFWKIQRFPAATQNWKSPTSWGYYVDIICWQCLVRYPQAFNPEFWYAYNRNPQAPILLFNINEDGSAYENPTNFDDSFDEIDDGGHLVKRESRYPRFSEYHEVPQFSLGMKFTDKKQFKEEIIKYGLHERKLIKFKKDDLQRVRAVCDWVTCPWTCLLSDTTKSESWQFTTFNVLQRCQQRRKCDRWTG